MTVEMVGGRYRLGRPLGSGGMAEVFDAMDERLERPVAVKLLRTELSDDAGLRRRFEVEARSAARLVHPNVVAVFDTGEAGQRPYIVMERLPGDTLADRLREGRMDEAATRRLASEVLGALAVAHGAGIVHRDVKPSNILWATDGSAKVADFGIAKGISPLVGTQTGDITATNLVIGTPAYLAPERLVGQPATPRSDLWSLGVVLYEAMAGERPFRGGTALAHDPEHTEPIPIEARRPGMDPALAAAISRALARDPAQRFASAAEMAVAAGVVLAGVSGAAANTALATTRLENDPNARTSLLEGPQRTAMLGAQSAGVDQAAADAAAARDERTRRLRAIAILGVLLVALAGIAIAALATTNGGSTPGTTTSVPPTSAVTLPPTTRAPVTTTVPSTTTTVPTTTTSSSTTTSSTTSTTSGNAQDHKNGKAGAGGGD